MLKVRRDLCLGCGLCVESCPQQAIAIAIATANINQNRLEGESKQLWQTSTR
jgi:ferredoxin